MIRAEGLVVTRGRTAVLHGLTFDVPAGSITGLMGPSGCGKTTLMRAVVGAQAIAAGTLTVDGAPVGDARLRREIGYTSQGLSIYPDISVRDNVRYFAGLHGVDAAEADRLVAVVGLAEHAHHRVDRLSGGQAHRASLACALVGDPAVLVLDEPTVGLDPVTREGLWELFRDLAGRGVTLLISSHVMDEATRCDTVLFMREGRILAHEPVARLQAATGTATPEDAFLALVKESA
ncbi:ABC transporter ATP-binding protein [Micrococcus endophyticus]|uniref:ABC-2 type transport system ATP-binding protein n=1 Tax=Micrococcus endophyticus TaxID=455343 RepID=A0A7W9JKW7_9MICC|nr:ABC transporter ATP-binding protein [Micrococcus endophyticus]MBB5849162.1 ABC-2 type transport system ATP-binding protein [Micrococcus endophyticus]